MLSGATSPIESMPAGHCRSLIQASPTVHFVKLAQAVLYRAAGFEVVWPQLLTLASLGSLFLAGGARPFQDDACESSSMKL